MLASPKCMSVVLGDIRDVAVHEPIEVAFAGRASRSEQMPTGMNRAGTPEQTWCTLSFSPIYLDDGKVGGAFCVTNEVTARVVAQVWLADEHERLIRLFAQAPMSTCRSRPASRCSGSCRT